MPLTHTQKTSPTRESVWFVVLWCAPINGTAITYDNIGNPNKTLNAAGQWVNLQWSGRQLVKATMPNGTYETYTYDADGLRTSRKQYNASNTLTRSFTYTWIDGVMVGYNYHDPATNKTEWIKYLFDGGEIIGYYFTNSNGTNKFRYFARNLQGDLIGVYEYGSTGAMVCYSYDAWGKVTVTEGNDQWQHAVLLGYRGYQYDKETGLYYCQSRYYNPRTAKFLNFDEIMVLYRTIGGITNGNGFAYCGNNAVNFTDPDGYFKRAMHYGQTYKWALNFLQKNKTKNFSKGKAEILADLMAQANESVDKKWVTSPLNIYSEAAQSWHFNTNYHKTGSKYKNDTRDEHYKKQKAKAEKLMKSGKYKEAIQELGKGLHALQDKITHTHGKNGTSIRASLNFSPKQSSYGGIAYPGSTIYFYWHGLGSGPDSYKEANPDTGYKGCEKFKAAKKVTDEVLQLYVTIYKKKFG